MKKESKFKKILAELTSLLMEVQLATYVISDGSIIETAEDGTITNPMNVADGEYPTADGEILVVAQGKVVEVKPAPAEVEEPKVEIEVPLVESGTTSPSGVTAPVSSGVTAPAVEEKMMEVSTVDGKKLFIDSDNVVYVVAEDGSKSLAPEGQHELTNGMIIVVDAEGKIVEEMSKSVKDKMEALNKTVADLHNKVSELEAKLSSTPAVTTPIGFKKTEETTDYSKLTVAQRAALAAIARKNGGVK